MQRREFLTGMIGAGFLVAAGVPENLLAAELNPQMEHGLFLLGADYKIGQIPNEYIGVVIAVPDMVRTQPVFGDGLCTDYNTMFRGRNIVKLQDVHYAQFIAEVERPIDGDWVITTGLKTRDFGKEEIIGWKLDKIIHLYNYKPVVAYEVDYRDVALEMLRYSSESDWLADYRNIWARTKDLNKRFI